jgi:hypothetical protein
LRKHELGAYCEGGRVLLKGCYGGSVEAWRSKSGRKRDSLRRLAARPDCTQSIENLRLHIAIHVACSEMPFVFEVKSLTASHVRAVLGLDLEERVQFLKLAQAGNWSARRLKRAVVDYRREQGERRGAPAATPLRLADTRIGRYERGMQEVHELLEEARREPALGPSTNVIDGLRRLQTLVVGALERARCLEPLSSVRSQKVPATRKVGDHAA